MLRPKLRSYMPILEAYAKAGNSEKLERLYRDEVFPKCALGNYGDTAEVAPLATTQLHPQWAQPQGAGRGR